MMYANINPADSLSGFGIGTYNSSKDGLVENIFYNASDSSKNETPGSFKLMIEKTALGYKQIINNMMGAGWTKIHTYGRISVGRYSSQIACGRHLERNKSILRKRK